MLRFHTLGSVNWLARKLVTLEVRIQIPAGGLKDVWYSSARQSAYRGDMRTRVQILLPHA